MSAKHLKDKSLDVQVLMAKRNYLKSGQLTRQAALQSRARGTAAGDVFLDGLYRPDVSPGDIIGSIDVSKARIEDQLEIIQGWDPDKMWLMHLTGELRNQALGLWMEKRPERPVNLWIIMKKKVGRPALNTEEKRVKISISVSPHTADYLDASKATLGSRGHVVDALVRHIDLATKFVVQKPDNTTKDERTS